MEVYLSCPSELLALRRKDVIVAIPGAINVCSLLPATQETHCPTETGVHNDSVLLESAWPSLLSSMAQVLLRSPSKLSGVREFGRDVIVVALPLAKTHRW